MLSFASHCGQTLITSTSGESPCSQKTGSNVTRSNNGWNALLMLSLLLASTEVVAQGSMLRISCEGESAGAEVSANGQFKGECPLDMQVNAGKLLLRVIKKVDVGHVRVFEQEVRMGDGVVKRLEIVLGAPELTPEGRKIEDERIQQEQIAAQAREEERRKAAASAKVLIDKRVDQLLQTRRAMRAGQTPECPDCPPLILPPGGRPTRTNLPTFSDREINGWVRAIERELAAYHYNPQDAFRLPSQVQPWPCAGAESDIRRIADLVSLEDETPQKREAYRTATKKLGPGDSTYYYRDVRMWPVQMACKNGKLDGSVDVWVYSMRVSDNPRHLLAEPSLMHLVFTAANGEPVGALHRVTKAGNSVTEYKDAAINKLMQENGKGDSEVISFTYDYGAMADNARTVTVSDTNYAHKDYQDVNTGPSASATFPIGGGRTETLYYQGARLVMRALEKDGKGHGPTVLYGQTIKGGFFTPDINIPEKVICYRNGVQIQTNPCNVE
jgi:hypothetical protein